MPNPCRCLLLKGLAFDRDGVPDEREGDSDLKTGSEPDPNEKNLWKTRVNGFFS